MVARETEDMITGKGPITSKALAAACALMVSACGQSASDSGQDAGTGSTNQLAEPTDNSDKLHN